MNPTVARAVVNRSGGRCEARYPSATAEWGYRCHNPGDQIHHALPKGQGGRLLDADGCIDHLLHLCRPCHDEAHAHPERAYRLRHLVRGSVMSGVDGTPVYTGDDLLLSDLYGETSP